MGLSGVLPAFTWVGMLLSTMVLVLSLAHPAPICRALGRSLALPGIAGLVLTYFLEIELSWPAGHKTFYWVVSVVVVATWACVWFAYLALEPPAGMPAVDQFAAIGFIVCTRYEYSAIHDAWWASNALFIYYGILSRPSLGR